MDTGMYCSTTGYCALGTHFYAKLESLTSIVQTELFVTRNWTFRVYLKMIRDDPHSLFTGTFKISCSFSPKGKWADCSRPPFSLLLWYHCQRLCLLLRVFLSFFPLESWGFDHKPFSGKGSGQDGQVVQRLFALLAEVPRDPSFTADYGSFVTMLFVSPSQL